MNPRLLFIPVLACGLYACAPQAEEADIYFDNQENIYFEDLGAAVELVHDVSEYVRFTVKSGQQHIVQVKDYSAEMGHPSIYIGLAPMITNYKDIFKVEIHYKNLRRLGMINTLFGDQYSNALYTREPIVSDSLDLTLYGSVDSLMEIQAGILHVNAINVAKTDMKGQAANFHLLARGPGGYPLRYNFSELETDSCWLSFDEDQEQQSPYENITLFIHTNTYLNVQVGAALHSISDNPLGYCYIYYTGHPTIVNSDSTDNRVHIVDAN